LKTKTLFAFRIDIWDDTGDSIVEHVAWRAGSVSLRNDHDGRAGYSYLLQDPGKRQANHDDSTGE
jgi:hypothetical protein